MSSGGGLNCITGALAKHPHGQPPYESLTVALGNGGKAQAPPIRWGGGGQNQ